MSCNVNVYNPKDFLSLISAKPTGMFNLDIASCQLMSKSSRLQIENTSKFRSGNKNVRGVRIFRYILFACEPYETVAFKIPNEEVDKREGRFITNWDSKTRSFSVRN